MSFRWLLACCFLLTACPPAADPGYLAYFTATPQTLLSGEAVTLAWKAVNTSGCTLAPGDTPLPAEGTVVLFPTVTTNYLLRCGANEARVKVTVEEQVRITHFTASSPEVLVDDFVTLDWAATAASRCFLFPGDVELPAQGTRDVRVPATMDFELTCEGYQGPAVATVRVTATQPMTLQVPTAVAMASGDGFVTVTWSQPVASSTVYLAEAPGIDTATIATLPGGAVYTLVRSPFVVSGLVNGRTYYARVSASSGAVESGLSVEVSGAPVGGAASGDTFASAEWHLANTGQLGGTAGEDTRAPAAWAASRGEGVRVAIVDEGVDLKHLDLFQNVATGKSHDYLGSSPLRLAEHGTCVAGLVAARDDNGRGVRGVSPRANLVSYNVLQDLTSSNELDAMVRGMDVVGVSNNSWGDAEDGTGLLTEADPVWLVGVERGTRLGRGGKGVVYLWAAGNGADATTVDDSNYDGQANSRYVLAIGGVGDDGKWADYAERGANLAVAAPTGGRASHALTTTDITGALGYNDGFTAGELSDGSYTQTMDGTSASTPVAAGVAALVLKVRPDLTWRDVRRVLQVSARRTDPTDADWVANGAGHFVNHKYGFGVVDADQAVRLAQTFVAGAVEVSHAQTRSVAAAIPDFSDVGASSSIDVTGSGVGRVEFVEVTLTATHPRSGDLEVVLTKQGGVHSALHVPHDCEKDRRTGQEKCSAIDAFTFGSTRHLDEPGDGRWTLTLKDRATGNSGTFVSWTLRLFGRP